MLPPLIKVSKSQWPSTSWFPSSSRALSLISTLFRHSKLLSVSPSLQEYLQFKTLLTHLPLSNLSCNSSCKFYFFFFLESFPNPVVELCLCYKAPLHCLPHSTENFILIVYWVWPRQRACLSHSMLHAWFPGQSLKHEDTLNICMSFSVQRSRYQY